jgi:hypothetical protein
MTTLTVLGYPEKLNRNLTRIHNVFLTKVVGEMSIQTYCAHSGKCVTSLLKQKHDRLCKVCELCSPAQCSSGCICATIWIRWVVLRRTNISCQSPTVMIQIWLSLTSGMSMLSYITNKHPIWREGHWLWGSRIALSNSDGPHLCLIIHIGLNGGFYSGRNFGCRKSPNNAPHNTHKIVNEM